MIPGVIFATYKTLEFIQASIWGDIRYEMISKTYNNSENLILFKNLIRLEVEKYFESELKVEKYFELCSHKNLMFK